MNNYHILRASLSVCPARSAERTFQASLYTAPFPALSFGGADLTYSLFSPEQIRIPSTHPLRGATSSAYRQYRQYGISIHAPLAGCDLSLTPNNPAVRYFNPRTPCGVRHFGEGFASGIEAFQSTHPLRGATPYVAPLRAGYWISIHAPLAGCDPRGLYCCGQRQNFNPRTPCGVRPGAVSKLDTGNKISIHAPLAGCDL